MKSLLAAAALLAAVVGWSLISLASVIVVVAALWITSALASASATARGASSTATIWALAAALAFGVPLALALWKHGGSGRRVAATMAWLLLLWNAGGLLIGALLVPDLIGAALRGHGAWFVVDEVGDSHTWTRYLSALGHNTADLVDPRGRASAPQPPPTPVGEPTPPGAITVPFSAEGNAIVAEVELTGPAGSARLPYLFDTGASFTTISSATAARLGVHVGDDAPTLSFNTASGPRESRMVYLPALRLGDVTLRGLLVSVCDGCTNDRTEGLLGLNVIREFFVHMDYLAARMHLVPRMTPRPNRAYDINPAVQLDIEGRPEIWLGRVRWVVVVHNRAGVPLLDLVPEVRFSDGQGLRGAPIARIEPGERGRSLVEGKTQVGEGSDLAFTLTLVEAYW
jgi:hypothetical protein